MDEHSDFRISSFQVVDAWRTLQFNSLKNILKILYGFSFVRGEGAATHRIHCLKVFRLEKTLKIGKNIKNAVVLVCGRQILENSS